MHVFWLSEQTIPSCTLAFGNSCAVMIRKPADRILSTIARVLGTQNPIWFTVEPIVPPDGLRSVRKTSALGNLKTVVVLSGHGVRTPPRVFPQNRSCALRSVTFKW